MSIPSPTLGFSRFNPSLTLRAPDDATYVDPSLTLRAPDDATARRTRQPVGRRATCRDVDPSLTLRAPDDATVPWNIGMAYVVGRP